MEQDSGTILREISLFKNTIDQVNEEIEGNIQRTRQIESEILRCSEMEKSYLLRESKLLEMVSCEEFELNSVLAVSTVTSRNSLELAEEINAMNSSIQAALRRTQEKREKFLTKCQQFQKDIVVGESKELRELLSIKDELENERQSLISKVHVLKDSTAEFIEEELREIQSSTVGLEVRVQHASLECKKVLKDIEDLKNLICSLI